MRTAALFLDAERLSALVGTEVVAKRLRHKPGLSTVAALHTPDGVHGWAQVASRAHDPRIVRAVRRAGRAGQRIRVIEHDGLTLAFGPVASDPELAAGFAELGDEQRAGSVLLRYNPHRRAVLRGTLDGAPVSIRVHGERGDAKAAQRRARGLLADGVPTIVPLQRTRSTSTWAWEGESDLAHPSADGEWAARRAGEALARLHTVGGDAREPRSTRAALLRQAEDLAVLDEHLGRRARRLVEEADLTETDLVPAHGDFSADQVAIGPGGVWLLDFDRYRLAPRLKDLGGFHAVELLSGRTPLTGPLLEGYGVDPGDALRPWVFAGLAARLMEPLRDADPRWRDRISDRLDQMEQWRR
ncbi:hypothetical protein SAMN04488242_1124 [Tessaracoccus oleiagri]|uniref:Uncharacterized protein n=2 Tax=Tessaracoccus oleiagri TaxID=686624 RepID=A0A1G9J9T9_9ACTN|nr:hypothetical protein SAMN04488242_1124 [Tessaracoccus oleiagri]